MRVIRVNEIGLKEIAAFLAANHKDGDHFTRDMIIEEWAARAEFQLAIGEPATITVRAWDCIHGDAMTYRITDAGLSPEPAGIVKLRIATIMASRVFPIPSGSVRDARAIARSWLKKGLHYMWGGEDANVYVKTSHGCWHLLGTVGNQTSAKAEDEFDFMRQYQWR
jgi:hypothetical protein